MAIATATINVTKTMVKMSFRLNLRGFFVVLFTLFSIGMRDLYGYLICSK